MPDLRKDPITGRWVIISTDRSRRPSDFSRESFKIKGGFCPFCYGNESKTPPEIMAYRPKQNGGPEPKSAGLIDDREAPAERFAEQSREIPTNRT